MRQTNGTRRPASEKRVKDIKRAYRCPVVDTQYRCEGRKQYSSEEKVRIVLGGLRPIEPRSLGASISWRRPHDLRS